MKCIHPDSDISEISGLVIVFNTESVWYYLYNFQYRAAVHSASYICIDGAALKLIALLFGVSLPRYHGPEFLNQLEIDGLLRNACVIGGHSRNQELVDQRTLGSWIDVPYSNDQAELLTAVSINLNKIKASKIILVSLGLPKQELLAFRLCELEKINNSLVVPIGAALDFRTGSKVRSSKVWRQLGLEWLPRLVREPRMWRRNVRGAAGLVILVWLELKLRRFR